VYLNADRTIENKTDGGVAKAAPPGGIMNIDKRYVELLATVAPGKRNRWWYRLAYMAYFFFIIGAFLAFSKYGAGYGLSIASLVLLVIAIIRKNKDEKKVVEEFVKYYEKNGAFPPWPDDVK
jgi:hypothetical protein